MNDLKSNRISTGDNKSSRINTSENYCCKPFRINTSRKYGARGGAHGRDFGSKRRRSALNDRGRARYCCAGGEGGEITGVFDNSMPLTSAFLIWLNRSVSVFGVCGIKIALV